MKQSLIVFGISTMLLAACGPPTDGELPDGGADTGMPPDMAPSDTEPPEVRDIQVSIEAEVATKANITDESATRILPTSAPGEFTVFAQDDETDRENLTVEAVDAEGNVVEAKMKKFERGLWTFTVDLAPGMELHIEITDEAGNTKKSEHSLTIPSRAKATEGTWENRFFENDDLANASNPEPPPIKERFMLNLKSDGTWEEDRNQFTRGGDFRIEDGKFILQRTYQTGGMGEDSDESTIEADVESEFYVDEIVFSRSPWTRRGSGSGLAGTWERTTKHYSHSAGSRSLSKTVEETLELEENENADNTWEYTRMVSGGNASMSTRSGTWASVEITTNYGENFGSFLIRTTTHEDGTMLQNPTKTTREYRTPLDRLLISPYVRE